ncbi:unnamed protein product, partial [Staurois parvus]
MGPYIPRLLMLLPSPESVMGPCTASHCCCLHRHTLCHVPLSGLLTHCWCVKFFDIGCWQITGLHSCCQAPNAMGPYTASSCCCQVQSLSWVPVRPPIAAV